MVNAPLLTRSVSDLLYGYGLSAALKNQYVYDPDYALSREPDIWETVRRDGVVFSAIDRFVKNVVRPWRVEASEHSKARRKKNKLLAAIMEEMLGRIQGFGAARRRLALGFVLGRSYEFIQTRTEWTSFADQPDMEWIVPTGLVNIDRRRFHIVADNMQSADKEQPAAHLSFYSLKTNRWVDLTSEQAQYFIRLTAPDTEDRVGYGRPLLEAVYFYHYAKMVVLEKILQGIDRWANGVWIGRIDGLRNASTSKTNTALRDGMKTVLQTMRSEHIAVLEKVDDISVLETTGTGHQISMDAVRYLDEGIERVFNGSILPAGHAEGTGSKARAGVEQDTSEAFYQAHREDMDDTTGRDLLGLLYRLNFHNFVKLGLADAEMPKFDSEQVQREDPLEAVQVMNAALDHGVALSKKEYYRKINCGVPDEDEEVIEGRLPMETMDPSFTGNKEPYKAQEDKASKSEE